MIKTKDELITAIKMEFRFMSAAAENLGFKTKCEYQRFRNTVYGVSKDYQVISAIKKHYKKVDTVKMWGVSL